VILDRHEPGDDPDERRFRCDPEPPSDLSPPQVGSKKTVELEAERHDPHSFRSSDPQTKEIPALSIADGQDLRTDCGEATLNVEEETCCPSAEIAMKDMSVEGVDNDWSAGQFRSDPAESARLGGMRMHNVRSYLAKQPDEFDEGCAISMRSELTPELRQDQRLDALFGGEIVKVALPWPFPARHEDCLVAAGAQALRQKNGVDSRAPDIEAANDAADASGVTHAA